MARDQTLELGTSGHSGQPELYPAVCKGSLAEGHIQSSVYGAGLWLQAGHFQTCPAVRAQGDGLQLGFQGQAPFQAGLLDLMP